MEQFRSSEGYYATALHELTHWSRHKSRLDRAMVKATGGEVTMLNQNRVRMKLLLLLLQQQPGDGDGGGGRLTRLLLNSFILGCHKEVFSIN